MSTCSSWKSVWLWRFTLRLHCKRQKSRYRRQSGNVNGGETYAKGVIVCDPCGEWDELLSLFWVGIVRSETFEKCFLILTKAGAVCLLRFQKRKDTLKVFQTRVIATLRSFLIYTISKTISAMDTRDKLVVRRRDIYWKSAVTTFYHEMYKVRTASQAFHCNDGRTLVRATFVHILKEIRGLWSHF